MAKWAIYGPNILECPLHWGSKYVDPARAYLYNLFGALKHEAAHLRSKNIWTLDTDYI